MDTTMSDDSPGTAGVIARPPRIFAAFLLLGAGLELMWPSGFVPELARYIGGFVLIPLGVALMAAAMGRFRRAGTAVETWRPSTAVVREGPYAYSRNPIYVAMISIHIGIGVAADSLWILGLLLPVLALLRWGVIAAEERYMEAKFGADYRDYKASVRRWL
jgi:protein-S-isoprenylcysteine O-methyltransferase Ste14